MSDIAIAADACATDRAHMESMRELPQVLDDVYAQLSRLQKFHTTVWLTQAGVHVHDCMDFHSSTGYLQFNENLAPSDMPLCLADMHSCGSDVLDILHQNPDTENIQDRRKRLIQTPEFRRLQANVATLKCALTEMAVPLHRTLQILVDLGGGSATAAAAVPSSSAASVPSSGSTKKRGFASSPCPYVSIECEDEDGDNDDDNADRRSTQPVATKRVRKASGPKVPSSRRNSSAPVAKSNRQPSSQPVSSQAPHRSRLLVASDGDDA